MASVAAPSSADEDVCAALALGWQVAQLFHSPVREGPVADPSPGDHLPGRSLFSDATKSKWLGEQIQSQVTTRVDSYGRDPASRRRQTVPGQRGLPR
jgi:hypothetical protein